MHYFDTLSKTTKNSTLKTSNGLWLFFSFNIPVYHRNKVFAESHQNVYCFHKEAKEYLCSKLSQRFKLLLLHSYSNLLICWNTEEFYLHTI